MFAVTGHILLALACLSALVMAAGGLSGRVGLAGLRTVAVAHLGSVGFAFVALITAFVVSDFSLEVVYANSHRAKPLFYRVAGAWGNHEGSMLLWVLISAAMLWGFAAKARRLPERFAQWTLGFGGVAALGMALFVAGPSTPFATLPGTVPLEGRGLNPLLQDIGLVIHPPVLYLGYVGLLVPWALALAALVTGADAKLWARAVKPWAFLSLAFLTLGIMLGSWWAYRELGWGGWWFWDPVENVSVIPWLLALALAHSAVTASKRGQLVGWSMALAILAYGSTLLGTFLVRSGTLVSVHAFAADPSRGLVLLAYLTLLIGGGLVLLAARLPRRMVADSDVVSRDTAMQLQNVLIVAVAATIMLGTVYPPLMQALGQPPIAVGAPFYVISVVPLIALALVLMAVSTGLNWRGGLMKGQKRRLLLAAGLGLGAFGLAVALGTAALSAAVIGTALALLVTQFRKRPRRGPARSSSLATQLSHAGVAVFAVSATLSYALGVEADRDVAVGQTVEAGPYTLTLAGLEDVQGDNYVGVRGVVDIAGAATQRLLPEYRIYPVRDIPTTEADIHTNVLRDLRVSLNLVEAVPGEEPVWALRFHRRPAMIWLWISTLVIAAGLLLSARTAFADL